MGLLLLLGVTVLVVGGFILMFILSDADDGPNRGP